MQESEIKDIVEQFESSGEEIIPILYALQSELGYLNREWLEIASEKTQLPLSQVYSVAKFFTAFSLKPRGEHTISVCLGTTCHVKGNKEIFEHLKRELRVEEGETTDDGLFTLQKVRCLGCCSLAPVMMIDDDVYGNLTREKAVDIVDKVKEEGRYEDRGS